MTVLLLAGTLEAREVAAGLAAAGAPAVASLAGATRQPSPLPLPTRVGGFGGDEGFAAYLGTAGIAAVVDATHPFAARVTARTHRVCRALGVPLLRVERPGWPPGPGDAWRYAADEAEAADLLPLGAVVLLATGRQTLPAWAALGPRLRAARVHLRVVDPPDAAFPLPGGWVVGRPPFDAASEAALLSALGATHLVAKDAGGAGGRPKLDAARALGLPVILLRRPPPPPGLATVATAAEAVAWALALSGPRAGSPPRPSR